MQATELAHKKCLPCEGMVNRMTSDEAREYLRAVPHWKLVEQGDRIRREWIVKDFVEGLHFFQRIGELAEEEQHHPDLHLEGYRHVAVEIWTHAIGGLSENDFILAAKIDELPVTLRQRP